MEFGIELAMGDIIPKIINKIETSLDYNKEIDKIYWKGSFRANRKSKKIGKGKKEREKSSAKQKRVREKHRERERDSAK